MTCLIDMKLFKDDELCYDFKQVESSLIKEEHYRFTIEGIQNDFEIKDDKCIFTRENDEFKFVLDTQKEEATYLLKEIDTTFMIQVEKCEFKRKGNKYILTYQLETDDHLNKIELTKGEEHE